MLESFDMKWVGRFDQLLQQQNVPAAGLASPSAKEAPREYRHFLTYTQPDHNG